MSNGIFANNWDRVCRLIPSLGRANDFEVVAAARAIGAALKAEDLDFHDLAYAVATIGQTAPQCGASTARDHAFGDIARACRDLDRGYLTPRERLFVHDMCARGFAFRPSSRQAGWLADILDRLRGSAAA